VGEQIVDLNRADTQIPRMLRQFIESGAAGLDRAQRVLDTLGSVPEGAIVARSETTLRAPWPERRIACAGGNYGRHLLGMWGARYTGQNATIGQAEDDARKAGQWGFWKVPDECAADGDTIPWPSGCEYLDYEGEAAIVFGKRGKGITADQIDQYVWGITLLNDWSIRDARSPGGGVGTVSYSLPKNFEHSTSLGPSIVVGELSWQDVPVTTKVNDEVRQNFSSSEMIWGFGELAEYISRTMPFVPGDIFAGGTSAGTAADLTGVNFSGIDPRPKDFFLKPGDVVEVSSPKIGTLRNQVVDSA
jgi:2-keto-4-pentenoate hydratase/2-oxohepta-3-ene-1,7-dioic acid hydratase in catechol pathway